MVWCLRRLLPLLLPLAGGCASGDPAPGTDTGEVTRAGDSGEPDSRASDTGEHTVLACGDHPPEVGALTATWNDEADDDASRLSLTVAATDFDGDLGRYSARFWTDYAADGAVEPAGPPDYHREESEAPVMCDVSELEATSGGADEVPPLEVGVIVLDAAGHASTEFVVAVVDAP